MPDSDMESAKDGEAAVAEKLPELLPITTALLVDTSHEARSRMQGSQHS